MKYFFLNTSPWKRTYHYEDDGTCSKIHSFKTVRLLCSIRVELDNVFCIPEITILSPTSTNKREVLYIDGNPFEIILALFLKILLHNFQIE